MRTILYTADCKTHNTQTCMHTLELTSTQNQIHKMTLESEARKGLQGRNGVPLSMRTVGKTLQQQHRTQLTLMG